VDEAEQHAHERRLAGAVRAEQAELDAGGDLQSTPATAVTPPDRLTSPGVTITSVTA
jgi:hypothetical protein